MSLAHDDDPSGDLEIPPEVDCDLPEEFQSWIAANFPELYPSVPSMEDRPANIEIRNPFLEISENRHPFLRQAVSTLPKDGALDGYIKFRIRASERHGSERCPRRKDVLGKRLTTLQKYHKRPELEPLEDFIPSLPPDFDKQCKMDNTDHKLLKFCKTSPSIALLP